MSALHCSASVAHFRRAIASGNRFLVWDRRRDREQERAARAWEAALAAPLCRAFAVDGLLSMGASRSTAAARMLLHNADGSRAQACGNGLCVLAAVLCSKDVPQRTPLWIETDSGERRVWPLRGPDGSPRSARVSLGRPRMISTDEVLETPVAQVLAHLVDVGNPHLVVFVGDLERIDTARLGALLERHPRFGERTNVEFVKRTRDVLSLRVWERGVGLTGSCGSGAVAAAFAARELHSQRMPTVIETDGGRVRVSFDADDEALLEGHVELAALSTPECTTLEGILSACNLPAEPSLSPPRTRRETTT